MPLPIIQKKADHLAKQIVSQIINETGITYSRKEFEAARGAAIICQRRMLKAFKNGYSLWANPAHIKKIKKMDDYKVLQALTQAIYKLKFSDFPRPQKPKQ